MKIYRYLLIFSILFTTGFIPIETYGDEVYLKPPIVSIDRMYNMIRKLSLTDNARIAGKNSEKLAGNTLQTALTTSGYNVTRQWFPTWIKTASGARGVSSKSSNVFAKNTNFNPLWKTVILMAHYDGVYTPAANDNASGVAMAVELAKYFKDRTDLHINIIVLLTGAEEGRHHGSLYYVAHPLIPLASTALVINLDMVGSGSIYQVYNSTKTMQNGEYTQLALSIGRSMGLNMVQSLSSYSDHTSFEQKRIPSITFMNLKAYSYYHTDRDTIDKINKTTLQNISNMTIKVIEEVNSRN